jgi:hypothetical protein
MLSYPTLLQLCREEPSFSIRSSQRSGTGAGTNYKVKLSVGVTSHAYLLEIQGLFTQGSRHCRNLGESVGGISEMDSSDWSNGIRYHTFDARSDTEFKLVKVLALGGGAEGRRVFVGRRRQRQSADPHCEWGGHVGRGLHSFTFQLNLSRV